MISNDNFSTAMTLLQGITPETKLNNIPSPEFGKDYAGQSPILTAVKILNQTATSGSQEQKQALKQSRHKIESLNQYLSEIDPASDPLGLAGFQVKLPQTKFQRMIEIATVIPRIAFTILLDILLLPGALLLIIAAKCKANFNPHPDHVKKDKIPLLLLHGSGFNESEWIVGRQFMKKEEYGSVFSMNYDGLVSNDPTKGIEDYARDKITAEINRIKALTGQDEVILVGHSMGGLIAGYYAEHCAEANGVKVNHVISIASPWQGSTTIDASWKLGGPFSKKHETKRHQQMSVSGGTEEEPNFRQNLVAKALESERQGKRKYYNIWSTTDYAVPNAQGCLTEDPRRQRSFNYLGHYAIIAWPTVWTQTRSWLNEIYAVKVASQAKSPAQASPALALA